MIDREKIRNKVEQFLAYFYDVEIRRGYSPAISPLLEAKREVCADILSCIDRFAEESVTEDLEKEIEEKWDTTSDDFTEDMWGEFESIAIYFANWQKEQIEKNRIAACDRQTEDQYKREVALISELMEKENRLPTVSDGIEYGMKLQKEQMLKDSISLDIKKDAGGYPYVEAIDLFDKDDIPLVLEGDEVKLIIIKNNEL